MALEQILNQTVNPNAKAVFLGMSVCSIIGESLKGSEITGNNIADVIIKIAAPIITGILIPYFNMRMEERRERRNKNKKR
jgi:hypothetical protein